MRSKLVFQEYRFGSALGSRKVNQMSIGLPDGSRRDLSAPLVSIGSFATNDIVLNDPGISRRHAVIVREGEEYRVQDAGSLNGTYVNRERIEEAHLQHGDILQVGKYKLHFLVAGVTG